MRGLRAVLSGAVLLAALATCPAAMPAVLPSLELEDQRGAGLELGDLRGTGVVIVYGTRHAIDESVTWGKKLDARLQARGAYVAAMPESARPVRIIAVAQMGGIPGPFRDLVRRALRGKVPHGFSLWLDWDDRLGTLFGAHGTLPTVVVVGRAGDVRAVVTGPAEGGAWDAVDGAVGQLR